MLRLACSFVLMLAIFNGYAQEKTASEREKAALDSMFNSDAFVNMFKDALKPKSYFLVSAGMGNSYFSTRNKQLNASQLESKIVFTPSAAYFHKSGLSLTTTAYYASFNRRQGFYQFSLSPSYSSIKSKRVGLTVSYTHLFISSGYERVASPVKNEIYGSAYLKKPWVQPGISIGLSGGRSTDHILVDTVLNNIRRIFIDTITTQITAFSLNVFIQHEFAFYALLSKKDGFSVTPQIIVNAGSQRISETHKNPFLTRLKSLNNPRFKNIGTRSDKSTFTVQSLALNLNLGYTIGKFSIDPQVYLDYYLPSTTDKRFTAVYSVALSFAF